MHSHEATCPHAYKQIVDWLSDLAVPCACFICEFLSSKAVDEMGKLQDDNCETIYAIWWHICSKKVNTNHLKDIEEFLLKIMIPKCVNAILLF